MSRLADDEVRRDRRVLGDAVGLLDRDEHLLHDELAKRSEVLPHGRERGDEEPGLGDVVEPDNASGFSSPIRSSGTPSVPIHRSRPP
jgi:hypothetical protein